MTEIQKEKQTQKEVEKIKEENKQEKQLKESELRKELEEKTKLAEERLNKLKYLQADFENYKKSFEKEKKDIIKLANEGLVKDLLTIIDELEKALPSIENEKNKDGLNLLYRKLIKTLESHGLKEIEAVGKKFDPYYHEALLRENSDKAEGTILEELQKGYILKGKVIRHTKVKISGN